MEGANMEIALNKSLADDMLTLANTVFRRSAEQYRYLMAGIAALAFLIVNTASSGIAEEAPMASLLSFISLSSCVLSIGYAYFNYSVTLTAVSGVEVSIVNIKRASNEDIGHTLNGLNALISGELTSGNLRRTQLACAASVALALLTFGLLLL
ncbi:MULTISPECIES: hypothetical protein [Sinorhizobium]|uniref:hypothetical protein n=1 Tax=Sinorhizobium TaxID=28105 RepID=UPI0024B23F62|nr:hypothetical protein [Sinorhizobium terangae]WFU51886.1 hypothetical protein QA637_28640 [Sinorhizobium terangae]